MNKLIKSKSIPYPRHKTHKNKKTLQGRTGQNEDEEEEEGAGGGEGRGICGITPHHHHHHPRIPCNRQHAGGSGHLFERPWSWWTSACQSASWCTADPQPRCTPENTVKWLQSHDKTCVLHMKDVFVKETSACVHSNSKESTVLYTNNLLKKGPDCVPSVTFLLGKHKQPECH